MSSDKLTIADLAKQEAPSAFERVKQLALAGKTEKTQLAANLAIIERAEGKVPQGVEFKAEILNYVVRVPNPATTSEEWQKQTRPIIELHGSPNLDPKLISSPVQYSSNFSAVLGVEEKPTESSENSHPTQGNVEKPPSGLWLEGLARSSSKR